MGRSPASQGTGHRAGSLNLSDASIDESVAEVEQLDLYALRELWVKHYRHPAPRFFRREMLIRGIAYEMQVAVAGGLPPRTHKLLMKIAADAEKSPGFTTADLPLRLREGTRLVRSFKGVTHTVQVLDDGFEWNGERWRSLSAIARAISGTNWNGNAFFGLRRGKRREPADA